MKRKPQSDGWKTAFASIWCRQIKDAFKEIETAERENGETEEEKRFFVEILLELVSRN